MGLTDDYLKMQEEYTEKYGFRTVCVLQVGAFYEIYQWDPAQATDRPKDKRPDELKVIGHAREASLLFNRALTSKNKSLPHSRENPFMCGFPIISVDQYQEILLNNDYTIVRVDQVKLPNGQFERKVAEIISPATDINSTDSTADIAKGYTNQVMAIYLEIQRTKRATGIRSLRECEDMLITCGVACIDVTTGKNFVSEMMSSESDTALVLQELYRFLIAQHPRELIIHIRRLPEALVDLYTMFLRERLELDKFPTVLLLINKINPEFIKLEYHRQFLNKIFGGGLRTKKMSPKAGPASNSAGPKLLVVPVVETNTNIIAELDLEKYYYGTIAYVVLLQHCYDHNESIVDKISRPDISWIQSEEHLILMHNATLQLHLIPSEKPGRSVTARKKFNSILSVIDFTETVLGRRFLSNILLHPLTSPEKLEHYYAMIGEFVTLAEATKERNLLTNIDIILKRIPDIERYQRRLAIHIIRPNEFVTLFRSYFSVVELFQLLTIAPVTALKSLFFDEKTITDFNTCLATVLNMVDLDKLEKFSITDSGFDGPDSFLRPGIDTQIDQMSTSLVSREAELTAILQHLNTFLSGTRGKTIEFERNGNKKTPGPKLSKEKMKEKIAEMTLEEGEEGEDSEGAMDGSTPFFHTTPAKAKILKSNLNRIDANLCGNIRVQAWKTSSVIITSDKIEACCRDLESTRVNLMNTLFARYNGLIDHIVTKHNFFSALNRFVAILDYVHSNALCALRYRYFRPTIVNDAPNSFLQVEGLRHPLIERIIESEYISNDISLGTEKGPYGMLLYGLNAVGKTSLAKALAVLITMAQAGMWVPGKLRYKPYTKIITRLTGNDDLLKGQSSFVVEMMELRTILRNADSNTLVVADEICKGTETVSGGAITIASILTLLSRKTSFIFSTHLHNLPETTYLQTVESNSLRICHLATTYDEETHMLIYDRKLKEGPGSSLYGIEVAKSLDLDRDFITMANDVRRNIGDVAPNILNTKKSRYNPNVYVDTCSLCHKKINLETHHIREQKEADAAGFIDNFHKNEDFNLMVLCRECHDMIHTNNKKIEVKQTINGSVRMVK